MGATDPAGVEGPETPVSIADIHATMLSAVGIDPRKTVASPIGRTVKLSEGQPVRALLG